jgi:hypothetical protein
MKQILKDLLKTAKEQIFGEELPQQGKLVLSKKVSLVKMPEWGINKETLELTFQYGEKTYRGNGIYQIVRKYKYYSVVLWYVEEFQPVKGTRNVEKICLVITCWKGSVRA